MEHEESMETQNHSEAQEKPKPVAVKKECPSPDKSNSTKQADSEPVKSHSDINPEQEFTSLLPTVTFSLFSPEGQAHSSSSSIPPLPLHPQHGRSLV